MQTDAREVPEAVLFEILIRLPVKSLRRFRSVCTSWLSLISDRYFIRSHYAISETLPKLLVMGSRSLWELHVSDEDHTEPEATLKLLNRSTTIDYGPPRSVHRLVCLSRGCCGVVIVNPITEDRISIFPPKFSWLSYYPGDYDLQYYSFGFDPVADQHKLLCSSASFDSRTHQLKVVEHWVFTLGSAEKWRRIQVLNDNNNYHDKCDTTGEEVCINGVIYFQSFNKELGCARMVAFDLNSESFQSVKVSLPGTRELYSYKFIEFNGSVALAGDCPVGNLEYCRPVGIDLLVLEDFHKQIWRCERSASPPDCWLNNLNNQEINLVCAPRSGNLLVFTPSRSWDFSSFTLYFYDVRSNRFWSSKIRTPERVECVRTNSAMLWDHVESLLPLKGSSTTSK